MYNKVINKAVRDISELAESYGTDVSKIIWCGNNKYIVVLPNGKEIRI